MKFQNNKILILIRFLNLGFVLALILLALMNLIWTRATNGSDYTSEYLFELLCFLAIVAPLIIFYFLTKRFIDKLKKRTSSKSLIIIELGFIILTLIGLLMTQVAMITYIFDIVIFLGLLIGKLLLIILALDSTNDYKLKTNKA